MSTVGITPAVEPEGHLFEARGVSVRFGGLAAVSALTLAIRSDETLAVVGPNGAGKSTLFNVLTGQQKPTEGRVFYRGKEITRTPRHVRARLGISRTFQTVRMTNSESLIQNVATAGLVSSPDRASAVDFARSLLEEVGLSGLADRPANTLGYGEQKRLELARALAVRPKALLLDEVMAGLNPSEVAGMIELIRRLCIEKGCTVVLIEHLLTAVRSLADRVVVLDSGRVIADGSPEEVFTNKRVIEAYLGPKFSSSL